MSLSLASLLRLQICEVQEAVVAIDHHLEMLLFDLNSIIYRDNPDYNISI
jgi:hypothetical protein